MNIVVFTGAGISKESGIDTFRDGGIWDKYDPDFYATKKGWKQDREEVLSFYNKLRSMYKDSNPNEAHTMISKLQDKHNVTVITQNIDNLHERSGSKKVIHLHGEMTKAQSSLDPKIVYDWNKEINIGDKCEKGSQLRPHLVWFGENPNNIEQCYEALKNCDLLLIIGTSLSITYTISMLSDINEEKTSVIYIDPDPSMDLEGITHIDYIKEKATIGLKNIYEGLINDY